MKFRLIGLCGPARAGKDTAAWGLAEALRGEGYSVARVAFADPVKEMARVLIGDVADEDKEKGIKWLGGVSPRRVWQTLGTEWGREMIHPELWTRLFERRVRAIWRKQGWVIVLVPDVRFPNEAETIRKMGGVVIRVDRDPETDVLPHKSEQGLPDELVDGVMQAVAVPGPPEEYMGELLRRAVEGVFYEREP